MGSVGRSKDDRVFSVIMLCSMMDCDIKRLTYGVYLLSLLGMDCYFRLKINYKGVNSPSFESFLEDLEYIDIEGEHITLNEIGVEYFESFMLTDFDWEQIDYVGRVVKEMSIEDLEFVVLVDMLVSEVCEKYGVANLAEKKGMIIKSLDSLTSVYSDENLDASLKLLREIGRVWR